ncbi:MAG: hypothetical protein EXS67_03340 [Candidatus Margulisbacteria bacterium]|nr:hypothetical protein [Candidatus Margulisiibacteriota bacterium]
MRSSSVVRFFFHLFHPENPLIWLILILTFFSVSLYGQVVLPTSNSFVVQPISRPPSVVFSVDEMLVNSLLSAMGPISGSTTVNVPMLSGKAHWTVKNPKIQFLNNDAFFTANVAVNMGVLGTNSEAKGSLAVTYNVAQNLIQLSPKNAFVDLYFDVLGQRINFARLDMATFYKKPLIFAGPQLMKSAVLVPMPDGKTKQVFLAPEKATVSFLPRMLSVSLWLRPEVK